MVCSTFQWALIIWGPSDQDVPYATTAKSKTVSVQAFYMDETEVTNNEYRQFVYWVRDSIARRILGEEVDEEEYLITVNYYDEDIDPPHINWNSRIEWEDPDQREALEVMYYPEFERFRGRREIDARKLDFEYFWIDYRDAARKGGPGAPLRQRGMTDRSIFIKRDVVNVYPDTLCWVHDFTYAFNEPMTKMYFSHPAYDDYPCCGSYVEAGESFWYLEDRIAQSLLERDWWWSYSRFPTSYGIRMGIRCSRWTGLGSLSMGRSIH